MIDHDTIWALAIMGIAVMICLVWDWPAKKDSDA
jgi:hypothetical protein